MSMTVQALRDYVRTHLDTDSTELPDSLLDAYMNEAIDQIARSEQRWQFFETVWSFSTVGQQRAYPLSGIDSTVDEVIAVQGPRWRLDPHAHELMQEQYEFSNWSSEPRFWSQWGGSLYLWPTPSGVYSMSVRGYRKPVPPSGAAATPDLPAEMHDLVGTFMLARAYQQQDDEVMSDRFMQAFEQGLNRFRKRYVSAHRGGVRTIGGHQGSPANRLTGRLVFPWE